MSVDLMPTKSGISIGGLRRLAATRLREAGIDSVEADARVLLAHALGVEDSTIISELAAEVPEDARRRLEFFLDRRAAGEPVARIIGHKEFWSRSFRLGPDTLVPRPESETVVEAALAAFPDHMAPLRVLDLGTGAGILLAAIFGEFPNASGIGLDRSRDALLVARANLEALGRGDRARFVCGDWGAAFAEKFDLVVCNPPYIATHELAALPAEVRMHDPRLALDGGGDGLSAYRSIVSDLPLLLRRNGVAVLELGAGQESAVTNLTRDTGLLVCGPARPDLAGIPRALTLRWQP